ncbi:MAG TPA: CHAT domain-containing protein [Thermoanaerobaculia bacterium]|nr:CHAT domain-containing protein [Thermoanaerobaculia bacterium]
MRRLRDLILCLAVACFARAADDPARAIRDLFIASAEGRETGHATLDRAARAALRVKCIELHGVRVEALQVDGDRASAHATVALTKRERATGRAAASTIDYTLALRREDARWRVTAVAADVEALADRLLAAADAGAQRALLRDAPTLLTPELVRALFSRAYALGNIPDFAAATRAGELAGSIAADIGDEGGVALLLAVRSVMARVDERWDEARALAEESAGLARRADDPDALARALVNLGRSYDRDPNRALRRRLFEEVLSLEERIEDLPMVVRALNGLELDAWHQDDYASLRRVIDEQIRVAALAGDGVGLAAATLNLASMYDDIADPAACIEYASRAMELAVAANTMEMELSAAVVASRCLRTNGERERSLALARRAASAAGDPARKLTLLHEFALVELAHHHLLAGENDEAERLLREALALAAGRSAYADEPYILLARLGLQRRRYAEVLELTRKYLDSPYGEAPGTIVIGQTVAARAHRGLGDTAAALEALEAAMEASDDHGARLIGDHAQRAAALEYASEAFLEAVDLNVELGRTAEALACAEGAKGRVLLESLRHADAQPEKWMTAAEQQSERRLEGEIAALNRRLVRAEPRGREAAEIRDALERARVEYASFRSALHARYPRLRRSGLGATPVAEMLAAVPPRGVLLEYVVGAKQTYVFVVRRDGIRVRRIDVGRAELERKVAAWREQLALRHLGHRRGARALDALLLQPLEPWLASASSVGIVADGVLWQVPFEALIDAKGRYRIERHTMFYAPSIRVFLEIGKRERHAPRTLLAIGDPLVAGRVRRNLAATYRGPDLGPLPDARSEVETLRTIYGAGAAQVYVGAAATEERVKEKIAGSSVLHFATHGILDDSSPAYSRLLLAEGGEADGMFEAWELMKLELDADLVVMSACDSARGRVSAGEGMIGMTWAAFVAGARTSVASLWKVASKSTSTLMVDFHRELHDGNTRALPKASALRRAKLRMLRDPEHRHPFYWAPFVTIGEP